MSTPLNTGLSDSLSVFPDINVVINSMNYLKKEIKTVDKKKIGIY